MEQTTTILVSLNKKNLFSYSSGDQKPQIKVSAGPVTSKSSFW